jgi:hypothetical protein
VSFVGLGIAVTCARTGAVTSWIVVSIINNLSAIVERFPAASEETEYTIQVPLDGQYNAWLISISTPAWLHDLPVHHNVDAQLFSILYAHHIHKDILS